MINQNEIEEAANNLEKFSDAELLREFNDRLTMAKELSQARKLITELVKMGEFYASEHSWAHKGCHGGEAGHRFRILPKDRSEISPDWEGVLVGGKLARTVLSNNKDLIEKLTKE